MNDDSDETAPHRDASPVPKAHLICELYAELREHEAAMQISSDPEEKWRLRRLIDELHARIVETENE
jgi:hypothetical protein